MPDSEGIQKYKLGNWELQSGQVIPNAEIAYKTLGVPSSPSIIYPIWFAGTIEDAGYLIGDDKALNPQKYYIIIIALFGNGQSSSPSNTDLKPFPDCTMYDNVRAQYKLVTEHLGVTHARAVLGYSMGAAQTYQWATQYPDFMDFAVPICGAAKISISNTVVLEGMKAALLAAKKQYTAGACKGGVLAQGEEYRIWKTDEKDVGLKALGRVFSGWAFSPTFYRRKLYETVWEIKGLEDFMVNYWDKWAIAQ
ncbi:homoserine acetyltransferase, partial [Gymnopus androsaceus JB14]